MTHDEALELVRGFRGLRSNVEQQYEARAEAIRAAWLAGASITDIAKAADVGMTVIIRAIRKERAA